ncbi:hypothetical protein JCM8547_007096 [Rhodosporidiobolus lusitaniae]
MALEKDKDSESKTAKKRKTTLSGKGDSRTVAAGAISTQDDASTFPKAYIGLAGMTDAHVPHYEQLLQIKHKQAEEEDMQVLYEWERRKVQRMLRLGLPLGMYVDEGSASLDPPSGEAATSNARRSASPSGSSSAPSETTPAADDVTTTGNPARTPDEIRLAKLKADLALLRKQEQILRLEREILDLDGGDSPPTHLFNGSPRGGNVSRHLSSTVSTAAPDLPTVIFPLAPAVLAAQIGFNEERHEHYKQLQGTYTSGSITEPDLKVLRRYILVSKELIRRDEEKQDFSTTTLPSAQGLPAAQKNLQLSSPATTKPALSPLLTSNSASMISS